ncbi:hypothetical protein G7Y89_g12411 [Cudoniella acicularis]|uniref:Clr5 domain-containing protein n=1 Tax=Cudoniella acicularis TaxID=354080 RepID=A0A8H4VZP1_9HELO|nr:hypothetical protein G7Y89_g12411 [Cudoniella acicularis]
MPLLWESWKEEIRRLYIAEGLKLEDVRKILKERGFDASTRAYRMKLKEWRFEKNHRGEIPGSKGIAWNSVESLGQYELSSEMDDLIYSDPPQDLSTFEDPDECPQPMGNVDKGKGVDREVHPNYCVGEDLLDNSLATRLPLSYTSMSANEVRTYGSSNASISIAAGPIQIHELLPLIERPEADDFAFEILISKWQPGGEYMGGGNLFKMIHDSVPLSERISLTKAMLESQFQPLTAEEWYQYTGPAWARAWYAACRAETWNEAKKVLMEKSMLINLTAGPLFLDCALAVIAERQCTEFLVDITNLTSLNKPFNTTMIPEINKFREQVLDALDFFNGRDAKPVWDVLLYNIVDWTSGAMDMLGRQRELRDVNDKLSGENKRILEENKAVATRCQELRERNAFLEKTPQLALERLVKKETRYRKLISMYTSVDEEDIDRDLEELIKEREFWREGQRVLNKLTIYIRIQRSYISLEIVQASNAQLRELGPGLVALFVGGTSGIGEFTLKAFVQNTISPRVYIVGRSAPAAERIIKECKELNKDGKVEFLKANVTELAEVDRVCKEIEKKEEKINLIVQTQGNLTLAGRQESPEGIDRKFTLNFYSRMRFIHNLRPLLRNASASTPHFSRTLSVLGAGDEGKVDFNDLELKNTYSGPRCAAHTIVMNNFMTSEFASRQPETTFIHSFPSIVNTGIARELPAYVRIPMKMFLPLLSLAMVGQEETGQRQLFIATSGIYPPAKPAEGGAFGLLG